MHPVTRIDLLGLGGPGIDRGAPRKVILDRDGAAPPVGRAADMKRLLEGALAERGYLHPTITMRADTEHAPERATLVFTIEPGDRTRIGTIEVTGRPAASQAEFVRRLGMTTGGPFLRDDIRQRVDRYIEERRS